MMRHEEVQVQDALTTELWEKIVSMVTTEHGGDSEIDASLANLGWAMRASVPSNFIAKQATARVAIRHHEAKDELPAATWDDFEEVHRLVEGLGISSACRDVCHMIRVEQARRGLYETDIAPLDKENPVCPGCGHEWLEGDGEIEFLSADFNLYRYWVDINETHENSYDLGSQVVKVKCGNCECALPFDYLFQLQDIRQAQGAKNDE